MPGRFTKTQKNCGRASTSAVVAKRRCDSDCDARATTVPATAATNSSLEAQVGKMNYFVHSCHNVHHPSLMSVSPWNLLEIAEHHMREIKGVEEHNSNEGRRDRLEVNWPNKNPNCPQVQLYYRNITAKQPIFNLTKHVSKVYFCFILRNSESPLLGTLPSHGPSTYYMDVYCLGLLVATCTNELRGRVLGRIFKSRRDCVS
jgi:hypothetical protein